MAEQKETYRLLEKGWIAPFKIDDTVSGLNIEVKTCSIYTMIIINGKGVPPNRTFYFSVKTGVFDGTSVECDPPLAPLGDPGD